MSDIFKGPYGNYSAVGVMNSVAQAQMSANISSLLSLLPDVPNTNAERENPPTTPNPMFADLSPSTTDLLRAELAAMAAKLPNFSAS